MYKAFPGKWAVYDIANYPHYHENHHESQLLTHYSPFITMNHIVLTTLFDTLSTSLTIYNC